MLQDKNIRYNDEIVVINERQYQLHYELYKNYIKKWNEIQSIFEKKEAEPELANTTYSKFRCLKRGESYSLNAIILHELYFSNLGGKDNIVPLQMKALIEEYYSSYECWYDDFVATAKASRGWALLAFEQRTNRLMNISLDAHDEGVITYSFPILVLDVYEHAYYLQYGNDRESYIYNFMNNINWGIIQKRSKILY